MCRMLHLSVGKLHNQTVVDYCYQIVNKLPLLTKADLIAFERLQTDLTWTKMQCWTMCSTVEHIQVSQTSNNLTLFLGKSCKANKMFHIQKLRKAKMLPLIKVLLLAARTITKKQILVSINITTVTTLYVSWQSRTTLTFPFCGLIFVGLISMENKESK